MVIAHNISAVNTYKSLGISSDFANKAMEKLSSGYKINKAADDAAGLSISEKMRSQIRGLNQASENAENGISLIQTAEGALNEVHSILQRMRELSVQSATDTNASEDREALQGEIDQLKDEINRIGETTEFNGLKLFGGEEKPLVNNADVKAALGDKLSGKLQDILTVNADGSYSYAPNLNKGQTISIDGTSYKVGGGKNITLASDAPKIYKRSDNSEVTNADLAAFDSVEEVMESGLFYKYEMSNKLNFCVAETTTGNTGYSGGQFNTSFGDEKWIISNPLGGTITCHSEPGGAHGKFYFDTGTLYNEEGHQISPTEDSIDYIVRSQYYSTVGGSGDQDMLKAHGFLLHNYKGIGGQTVNVDNLGGTTLMIQGDYDDKHELYLTRKEVNISASDLTATDKGDGPYITKSNALNEIKKILGDIKTITVDGQDYRVKVAQSGDNFTLKVREQSGLQEINFHVGANSNQVITAELEAMNSEELEVAEIDVLSRDSANEAIDTVDSAIKIISNMRSRFGAIQNRLEYTINNLNTTAENMTASESTIRDVDMADEMMEYTKNNILQQAAQAMLVQANARPQQALQLLR